MTKQYCMYGGLAAWALLMYVCLIMSVRGGHPILSPLFVILASPALLAFLALVVEGRSLSEVASLRSGAWSFMIGDTFVLTSAVTFAAIAWRSISREDWVVSWWWTIISALVGLGAGVMFHRWDGGNYIADGAGNRLLSPTKLAHDFVAFPVLFGALVCIGIPLLLTWSWHTWAILGCVSIWIVLVVCDGLRGLSPFELHPGWDTAHFRVIPDATSSSP